MKTTKRALTAAILLSCACLMAPYYAHAAEGITIDTDGTIRTTVNVSADEVVAVRVEGQAKTVIIDADITSSGAKGIGLFVESGSENNITLNAGKTIQALGEEGIAVLFGSNVAARGAQNPDALPEIVPGKNFNVYGSLKGTKAAIYISENAMLNNINILSGASIEGAIIHEGSGFTNLTFGGSVKEQEPPVAMSTDDETSNTSITFTPDPNFNMTYSGKIDGINSLKMNIAGGTLEYNGTANVNSITINDKATLKGAGTYILGEQTGERTVAQSSNDGTTPNRGTFTNNGTFDLGDGIKDITITGNYEQTETGTLGVDFNSDAGRDTLTISDGKASIAGTISLTPQVDYYYNGQQIGITSIVSASSGLQLDPEKTKIYLNNISPVLEFTVADNGATMTINNQEFKCDYGKTQYIINVARKDNTYQSVADDTISAGIGSALDSDAKQNTEKVYVGADKLNLIAAIDFPLTTTNTDAEKKKVINTNIKKLNPNVVSSNAQAVLTTHTTLNNLVSVTSLVNAGSMSMNTPIAVKRGGLGPTKVEPPKYNSWRNIVIPFAAYTNQHNGTNGYTNHNSGVIGAMERTFANGLTHGYHAAINHQSTEDSGSTIKGEGIYLGTHASYAPVEWNGWSVFGSARLGVEQMRSHRRVYISDSLAPYIGTADGDWTGYSGSFNIGAALTKEHGAVKSGPFAALDYSFAHRPSVHEDGGAVRTNLESATYDSLRTQLGYRLVTNPKALHSYDSTQWQAHASVAWNHELLSDNGRTNYQLVEFPGATIEDNVETYGRDSMSIAGGVIFKTPNRLDVGLTLGSDIYRHGGSSIYGKVNFEWKF